ncbi:MAG: YlxR family protein [Clostridiales bacterium]|nr:YlxR family protein [Clostridiales bacterium]
MQHVPLRSCIVCRQQKDKSELVRIVRSSNGELSLDSTGKAAGRGAYVCRCDECIANMTKKRALSRVFKQQIPDSVYASITEAYRNLINNGQQDR